MTDVAVVVSVASDRAPECPGSDELTRAVAQLTGASKGRALAAHVTFERTPDGHRATIQTDGPHGGERSLEVRGEGCAALGDAVATSIALVWDELRAEPSVPPPQVAPAPSRTFLAAGLGADLGITRGLAPAAWLGVGLEGEPGWAQISLHAVAPITQSFDPGAVRVELFAAETRACWAAVSSSVRLGPCGGITLGAIRGRGDGYEVTRSSTQFWAAAVLGGEARVAFSPRWFGTLRADAILPVRRHAFTVDGAGTALLTPTWGGAASAGVGVFAF